MLICASCGRENPVGAGFCHGCGAGLAATAIPREVRKTVTALFCDVTGSTALGESTDPEALRALLARYFERMKAVVESHGGTVEKFIGDAVMAVFGVPAAHEDDALRACRAAVEMREAFTGLGIEGRVGVNTGEVVAGTEERLATGDAVNVAARLEQAAEPGEVLIGGATLALVRGAVVVEAVEPLALKGKAEPVPAFRLLAVPGPPERSHASRFVGRTQELAALLQAWDRALTQSSCELVTVVGDAGVGKSRLVAEALSGVEARVVRGRCLPYGEGITYWPVVEVVKQLDARPSDEEAAAAVRSLLGESDRPTSADEIAWAFRKLLEEQAPLVVCFDDLQWGEETFLDLVESMGLLSTGAPLLLLCMVRPELLERRPSWPVPLRLEPLAHDEADTLIGDTLPEDVRRRIADRAGGNPLFITEMLALATDDGEVEVPPTLRALLAARLDQLDEPERRVLERGAVEGEVFHRGAVQALEPDEPEVLPRLAALVRHELIRPERPQFPGEDGFRFRHLLIRDAAYDALPKAVRAGLHRRLADWLENKRTLVELDELVGYHLEQAARYEAELGRPDDALALRAGDRLLAAGRRSLGRGDERAAAVLLDRALTLRRPLRSEVYAELDLAQALWHDPERAAAVCEDAAVRAEEAGDETGEALARAMALYYHSMVAGDQPDELETLLFEARRRLEEAEDHAGLVYVWSALGYGVANARSPQRRLGCRVRAGAPPQPARGSVEPAPDRSWGLPGHRVAAGRRGARGGRAPARGGVVAGVAGQPRLAARHARANGRGLAGRPGGGGEAAERPPLGRLVARRNLDPRRRPRGCEQSPARCLRLARRDGTAPVPRDLLGLPRPFTVHARSLRRSGAGRRARAIAGRDARRPRAGLPLAPGAGTRPRAPRGAGRGRAAGTGGGGRERANRLA